MADTMCPLQPSTQDPHLSMLDRIFEDFWAKLQHCLQQPPLPKPHRGPPHELSPSTLPPPVTQAQGRKPSTCQIWPERFCRTTATCTETHLLPKPTPAHQASLPHSHGKQLTDAEHRTALLQNAPPSPLDMTTAHYRSLL
ncbi:Hypothetical predicted protein [Pelobates cultripes]|uniref:Uncharacterized protein n=1 Tax=Pelobates cultripes TaxID=61616 RepID=A0AAD1RSC5_PELCU|nr:Hypothetical predicted protein [Pelobates cultripes]